MTLHACPACLAAAERPHHEFRADCRGCCARAAARSPHFRRVKLAGRLDRQYQSMLDQFDLTHIEVRQASEIDALQKVEA